MADTPMPGEDPGVLPDDQQGGVPDPESEMGIEANPQPEPDSSVPMDDGGSDPEKGTSKSGANSNAPPDPQGGSM